MNKLISKTFKKIDPVKLITPVYFYYPEQLLRNIKKFQKLKKNNIEIHYAIKSNNHQHLIQSIISEKWGFDIASKEELFYLTKYNVDPSKISFSAPSKREEDIKIASLIGVKKFIFDSDFEIRKILKHTSNPILFARITAIDGNPAFDLSSKFGMNLNYFNFILKKYPNLVKGITFHVGSQNTSLKAWNNTINKVTQYIEHAKKLGSTIQYVNLGGGIPARYNGSVPDVKYFIDNIINLTAELLKQYPNLIFSIEPGRAIAANTMILVSRIINIKPYKRPPILVTDTGVFNGIIEPLEGFEYPIFTLRKSKRKKKFQVVGFSCDGHDIINRSILLPEDIQINDLIIFTYAGAYTFVYEKFHMLEYPKIKEISNNI